jgi:hypothetical protein
MFQRMLASDECFLVRDSFCHKTLCHVVFFFFNYSRNFVGFKGFG